jgi:hypothetical protein
MSPTWSRRERLVADVDRVRRYMVAVIVDARRAEVQIPLGITASVDVWRSWGDRLQAENEER